MKNDDFLIGPAVPLFNSGNWNPDLHPRDDIGRFTATGGYSGTVAGSYSPIRKTPRASAPLKFHRGIPPKAKLFTSLDGNGFFAPPGADFKSIYQAGKKHGTLGIKKSVGHYGKFDFQRNEGNGKSSAQNVFYPAYTDASNYAVGVYMRGAGYSENQAVAIARTFATFMSSNAGSPEQERMWRKGWRDAGRAYSR